MHRIAPLALILLAAACGEDSTGSHDQTGITTSAGAGAGSSAAASGTGGGQSSSTSATSTGAGMPGGAGGGGGDGAFQLNDSLANGTLGNQVGGSFGPDGWTVTAATDRIWYILPRLVEGSIEFKVSNMSLANLLVDDNEIFALYDGGHGITEPVNYNPEFRDNHYKIMLRIYGTIEPDRVGQQKLMWGMCPSGDPGYGECGCPSFFEEPFGGDPNWDGSTQALRVEWGGGVTRYLRNGTEVHKIDWSATGLSFGPQELHFSLGTSRPSAVATASLPIGAVFSDLVITGTVGDEEQCP